MNIRYPIYEGVYRILTVLPRYFLRFPIAGSAVANCGLPGPQPATVRPATAGRRKEPAFRIFPLNE